MEVIILFTLVIGLMLIGVPIAISLGMSSVLFLLVFPTVRWRQLPKPSSARLKATIRFSPSRSLF